MVSVERNGNQVVLRVLGSHRFWAFKSQIRFSIDQVASVGPVDPTLRPPWFRCPGTMIPWLICAGTYYGRGRKEFWDRTRGRACIQIEMKSGTFTRIVVDVPDAREAIELLQSPGDPGSSHPLEAVEAR